MQGWISETSTEYFARKDGFINNSLIKEALVSPRNLLKPEIETTEAMSFGKALHYKILEPEYYEEYVIILDHGFDTKSTQLIMTTHVDEKDDFAYITKKSDELIEQMYKAFSKTPKAIELVESCEKELSGYYPVSDKFTVKIKPDMINRNDRFMVDLKSTTSGQLHNWSNTVEKYKYHVQAGDYCSAADKIDKIKAKYEAYNLWKWLVIEKSEPFHVKIIECSPDYLEIGKIEASRGIDIILDAWNNKNYGQNDIEDVCTPPSWLVKQYQGLLH